MTTCVGPRKREDDDGDSRSPEQDPRDEPLPCIPEDGDPRGPGDDENG